MTTIINPTNVPSRPNRMRLLVSVRNTSSCRGEFMFARADKTIYIWSFILSV